MFKKSQRALLLHFLAQCDLPETSKKFRKKSEKISELLLSPVVGKVIFESYRALDMAPTWAVPWLVHCNIFIPFQKNGGREQKRSKFTSE